MKGRLTVVLIAALLPLAAGAQGYSLRPPSVGEALHEMDRLIARKDPPRLEQTFVVPERPGQNQVAWYEFEWRTFDIPSPAGGPGGIRLYFYDRERSIAERALPSIRSSYLYLVDQFHYSPTKRIPYILYSSHREFLATNVFQITEGTLGVTSPENLQMSLPYFGDHERFREVSTHEMVHQFMIQKLNDLAHSEGMDSPSINLPLWFIEGIAEYYTKGGLDPEADLYLRDLVWNPDPEENYQVTSFAEDRYRGYIPTYKLGQARVTFIADVYGKEKIQGFIESSHLVGTGIGGGQDRAFAALVRRVLNESIEQVDARWRAWLKRRYYPEYLQVRQDLPAVRDFRDLKAEPDDFDVSADGNIVFYRGLDRERGRVRLYLMDARHPRGAREVAEDAKPGIESLHPIDHDILALGDGVLAFAAQSGAGDVLYVQSFTHTPPGGGKAPRLKLGKQRRLEVRHPEGRVFIEISDPTFSMDSSHIAFVGLTEQGQRDIYIVPATGGVARQVTDDAYAERDLAWGRDGIYCSSDSTDHGRFNLFRIDPSNGARTRLTTADGGDRYPRPQADGSVLFTSYATGKPDVFLLANGTIQRLTDFSTGLTTPAAAPQGRGVYAATFYQGRFRMVEVPKVALLKEAPRPVEQVTAPPLPIPRETISASAPRYSANNARNWRPEAGIVYGGGTSSNVAGRAALLFTDLLRDRVIYLDLSIYGSWDYTQGIFLYENRGQRLNWAVGGFHFVQQQIDRIDPSLAYFQRDFGAVGTLRYPLDRFQRVELETSIGGVTRYCLTDYAADVPVFCAGTQLARPGATDWERRNGGVNLQLTPVVRYGYDTVRLDPYTGPIGGRSLLLELGGGYLPGRSAVHGFARADASTTWQIVGRANLSLRASAGSSFAPNENGRSWARSWWLSSADNLRGFYPLDIAYLVGQNFYVANAELQVPLSPIIRFLFFDYIEGVAALDFGGVFNRFSDRQEQICAPTPPQAPPGFTPTCVLQTVEPGAWRSRTLTGVLGTNVLFGPLLLRVHFGHPFDIGGQVTPAQQEGRSWVTNITLRYFFF
ncbi:MAG TPA: hypothetical protein VFK85_13645 [Anaeromyxobacteraceae bacterium]|nr:hypothetical protein [Anaeromyxobacteraceae bacterium]